MLFPGVFLSILGPRVGGIDFVAVGVLYLGLVTSLLVPIRVPRPLLILIAWHFVYLLYVYAIYAFTDQSDMFLLARTHRMVLSTVVLGIAFANIPIRPLAALNLVVISLLAHAFMTYAQLLIPGLREQIGKIYGFPTYYVPYRAMGLTGGYDGAALLCAVALVLVVLQVLRGARGPLWGVAVALFAGAAVITGRTGMIAAVLITGILAVHFAFRGRGMVRALALLLLAATATVGFLFVRVVLVQTVPEVRPWLGEPTMAAENFELRGQFAPQTLAVLWEMVVLPDSAVGLLFGTGAAPATIDIGWIRMVFMTGLMGFVPVIAIYFYMFSRSMVMSRAYLRMSSLDGRRTAAMAVGLAGGLIVLAFFNLKSLFFFSRSTHEMFIILFSVLVADFARRTRPSARASL